MHRCSSTSPGPCSCGLFHPPSSYFSIFYAMPNSDETDCMSHLGHSSSSVDCTLSLGQPSTRRTDDYSSAIHHRRQSSSCMSNLCWDIFQKQQQQHQQQAPGSNKCGRGGSTSNSGMLNNNLGGDALLARRCANCDTTSTPLWRNGPRGPKSLCNACGIRYKKEERRATSASSSNSGVMDHSQHNMISHHNPWSYTAAQTQRANSSLNNEFRFIEDEEAEPSDVPFLSWRLNDCERPGLLHDFT